MKRKVTLKQIAKELDVSISTVSKALRNSPEISDDTKDKVQAFAKLYNYKPNNIALSLKNRKTRTIGVIIPEIVHYFFSKVIKGIENVALERGYNVIIGLSNESFDKEVINMETLANGSIDGFILSVATETLMQKDYHHFNETINQGMPIVMFDRVIDEIQCDKVVIDDFDGAKKAVDYLLQTGSKRIGLITTEDYINVGFLRTKGYLEALNDHEVASDPNLIMRIDGQLESEEELRKVENDIEQLLISNKDIDAIFTVNELYAVLVLKVARKLGLVVPDDLQVIGFTDGVLSRHATPALTTVSQHAQEMGEASARLLIDKLEEDSDEETYETVVIETELIKRHSTLSNGAIN